VAEPPVPFAGVLRGLRAGTGLTQEELAGAAGLSPRAISDLERGMVTTPHKDTVELLADALRLDAWARVEFEAAARGRAGPGRARGGGAAAATRTLPRDTASFTGRRYELAELADAAAGSGGVVSIHAIGGMAGVGKTAFAVHAAHRLAGRFPGGQIFLPLHGHTPGHQPVDPADALASLLLTIGVPAGQIPADLQARTGLWRDRLAGRQLLLVLDDAADSEQIRPLLPGAGGSLVMVTSRRRLTALEDATTITLDAFPAGEAAGLLVRLAVRPGLSSTDPAVREVTRLCGCLPLAIGMVARQLYHHPAWTVAGLAAELAAAVDRLELLATENLSVAAAFDLSYDDLTPEQQRLFRRLGLHPGTDIDRYAVAALDGTDLAGARRGLEALYEHYLLTEPAPGRYRMHDLIREHARVLASRLDPEGDREQVTKRLLDYYQLACAHAQALLARHADTAATPAGGTMPAAIPVLASQGQALAWARAERTSLLACLDQATAAGQHARVIALTAGLAAVLRYDGPWDEAIARHATADQAARRLGDRHGQAGALTCLGDVRLAAGDYPGAARDLQEAMGIYQDIDDRHGRAIALTLLGNVRRMAGDYLGALSDLQEAVGIRQDFGDRRGQATTLIGMAGVQLLTGDYPGAATDLQEALGICCDLGDRRGQASALTDLGKVAILTGDYSGAARHLQEALGICRDLEHRLGQVNALTSLGKVALLTGDHSGAARDLQEALDITREIGNWHAEATTLNEAGTLSRTGGDLNQALSRHQQALDLARQIGIPLEEAHALAGLGRCALLGGHTAEAAERLRQALAILQRIGSAETADVAAELDALHGTPDPTPTSPFIGSPYPDNVAGTLTMAQRADAHIVKVHASDSHEPDLLDAVTTSDALEMPSHVREDDARWFVLVHGKNGPHCQSSSQTVFGTPVKLAAAAARTGCRTDRASGTATHQS
jgi:tetratricopeptide (TPR) repeat protein/transcriptional regulator with XRE-family HTH domain